MTERESFLAAIIADPQEDAPRLIFADWLEEHGERDRAEFIRVQCELAMTPESPIKTPGNIFQLSDEEYDWWNCAAAKPCRFDPFTKTGELCRYHALKKREQELHEAHILSWLGVELLDLCSLYDYLDVTNFDSAGGSEIQRVYRDISPVWRRGFIAEITLSCQDCLQHGEQLLRSTPLEKVTLTHVTAGVTLHEGYGLTCSVVPYPHAADSTPPVKLSVRDGGLWYETKPDADQDAFLIRIIPRELTWLDYTPNAIVDRQTIEDSWHSYQQRCIRARTKPQGFIYHTCK